MLLLSVCGRRLRNDGGQAREAVETRAAAKTARPFSTTTSPQNSAVEAISGIRPEIQAAIAAAVPNCLTETNLPLPGRRKGKVRDTYDLGDRVVIVTTDRQSAFDRLLAAIPFKGQVLNQTAAWWFEQTRGIVPNALLSTPDPNVAVMRKCDVFPVEFVVRGFMTGSTDTSLWTHYSAGARTYCGNAFPDGMRKNERLAANVITPTTKAEDHDEPIAPADIVARGLMSQADWDAASAAALRLFEFGQREAARRGLLLVDTKYEFGKDADGNVLLIDEVGAGAAVLRLVVLGCLAAAAWLLGLLPAPCCFLVRCCCRSVLTHTHQQHTHRPPTTPTPTDPHARLVALLARRHVRGALRGGPGAAEHRQGVPAAVVPRALRPVQRRGERAGWLMMRRMSGGGGGW